MKIEFRGTNKRIFIIAGGVAVAVSVMAGAFFFGLMNNELSAEKVAREVESEKMTELFANSDYLYHGAAVKKVNLTKDKDRERTYRGEVVFARGDRLFRRPISVSYTKEGKKINYSCDVDGDYSKHPEFLKEDADILFDRLKGKVDLREWKVVSAENLSPGIVRCSVKNGAEQGDVDIEVKYKNGRLQYEIVNIQGVPEWEYEIGMCCFEGKDGVEKNHAEAVVHFRRAAEKDHVAAQLKLGLCCQNGWGVEKDMTEAAKWFRKAAERGNPEAQLKLGLCYFNGTGVEKDMTETAKWFREAAERGHAEAQFNLGLCHFNGWGVAKNMTEAAKWFRKAAERGHAGAQFNLGLCYFEGKGVGQNRFESVRLFRIVAARNFAPAQYMLGLCYANGWGVAKNDAEAIAWLRKAAGQGFAQAQNTLRKMNSSW